MNEELIDWEYIERLYNNINNEYVEGVIYINKEWKEYSPIIKV